MKKNKIEKIRKMEKKLKQKLKKNWKKRKLKRNVRRRTTPLHDLVWDIRILASVSSLTNL